jgi:ribosome-associated toxin RatA of RatAB toxin-antitoxin module
VPEVSVSARLRATPDAVWALVSDMEAFPRFMRSVESVRVVERPAPDATVSEWVCRLQGMRFRWTERDEFARAEGVIRYRLVAGDLSRFEGEWQLTPAPATGAEETEVRLRTLFDFGLPMLSAMLDPVARIALRKNVESMLRGLGEEVARVDGSG